MVSPNFYTTTRIEKLLEVAQNRPILMLDGTVPNWVAREGDVHFDHHRPGGAKIQIDEMNTPYELEDDFVIVTTQTDADACVAAAYHLTNFVMESETHQKLRAIAFDCDHLYVPPELAQYADFAAQAVAAMKTNSEQIISQLGLNPNRKSWSVEDKEAFASEAFRQGTLHLVDAINGIRPWPGELGEAKAYWEQVEKDTQMLEAQNRITYAHGCTIINMKGLGGQYIDPRCALRVVRKHLNTQPNLHLRPVTLTQREVYSNDEFKGYSYTLGCLPWHPDLDQLDYTIASFQRLTIEEAITRNFETNLDIFACWGQPDFPKLLGFDPWGGRATVGGSGWNTPSQLTPQEVIDAVLLTHNYFL